MQELQAVFQDAEHEAEVVLDYEMIHVAPPQGPPKVVKESPLADEAGCVLMHNLLATMRGNAPESFKRYDGYSSCPIPTGYGKLVLAEFDYDLKPAPSFPFDTIKERRSMYLLKHYGLPALYWRGMLKGRA